MGVSCHATLKGACSLKPHVLVSPTILLVLVGSVQPRLIIDFVKELCPALPNRVGYFLSPVGDAPGLGEVAVGAFSSSLGVEQVREFAVR